MSKSSTILAGRARTQRFLRIESLERRRLLAAQIGSYRPAVSDDGLWAELSVREPIVLGPVDPHLSAASSSSTSYLRAGEFKTYAINGDRLLSQLASDDLQIAIPTPDGDFERFAIEPSAVMSPELAAKFPEIQTYIGSGIDSKSSVRLDVSPAGFFAQVITSHGFYYVDPYYHLEDQFYSSYYSRGEFQDFAFEEELSAPELPDDGLALAAPAESSGSELRTYRAAIAASAEYTAFHGGTVASGQAAIVTAVNRINGLYENELSIRLQLVSNNDQLVYTNAGTDPYLNMVSGPQIEANHANLDTVIGNDNYDIGHVLITDGGGLAGLGVVGLDSAKGEGTTGSGEPVGDGFWVDLLAHEIGHQFGADHTFNGDSLNCSGQSWASQNAYEPGSGSTIMAYAGICGNDDVQFNSDPYFHFASLDQIINHVDSVVPNVGTRTATGNSLPNVDAGLDFVVPAQTPFALTAFGSDIDEGDTLTYTWEQADLGPQQDVSAGDNGSSPIFRSFFPTTNPTRTFPRLADLLTGSSSLGETLPTSTRELNFRVTVRDNQTGGGAIDGDDVLINVVDTGVAFEVQSPNGGESFDPVSLQTVTWNVAGTTGNGIDTPNVNILLSTDGGVTFPITLADAVANDGSHDVVLPDLFSPQARIKVVGDENVFFDISDATFAIGIRPPLVCSTYEHFDGIAAPSLPAPWTTESTGVGVDWVLIDTGSQTAPNHAFVSNPADISDSSLISPSMTGPDQIIFQNYYLTESNFDGGVLEISISGEPFQDIIEAGGSFVSGAYNGLIPDLYGNPLGGRNAWTGDSQGYVETIVELPLNAIGQDIQLRWRLGSDNGFSAIGWRIDSIQTCIKEDAGSDYGDAPDPTFPTVGVNGGAVHRIGGTLFLGSQVDSEGDGQPTANAQGDDELGGTDDEDGVVLPAEVAAGETVVINVNASVGNGLLNAWIDFNRDGDWEDASEQIFSDQPLASGDNDSLSFVVPPDATSGISFARFRLSTQAGLPYDGSAVDGEVEDYQITILTESSISGLKYHDLDGDGAKDPGEPGLEGFTIFLDGNDNGALDPDEASVVTDSDGNYSFTGLAAGDYSVVELPRPGWTPTFFTKDPVSISSGEPTDLALLDLDGNEILDALVVVPSSDAVVRLYGLGEGAFTRVDPAVSVGGHPTAIAVGDFDGINGPDFATSNFNGDSISVRLNDGAGDFTNAAGVTLDVDSAPNVIATGNVSTDGDSDVDLFISLTGSNDWQAFANDGTGAFTNTTVSSTSFVDFARDTVVANFDDGPRDDVAIVYANTDNVQIVLNPATLSGATVRRIDVGDVPAGVAAADFNLDGYTDFVTANRDTANVSVVLNLGTGVGTFDSAVSYASGTAPIHVSTGDLNRDGAPDIAVADRASDSIVLLFNRGDGTFAPPMTFDVGAGPETIAVADVNDDGFDDLVSVNKTAKTLSVLVNSGRQDVTLGLGQDVAIDIGNRLYEAVAPKVEEFIINDGDLQRSFVDRTQLVFNTFVNIDETGGNPFRIINLGTTESVELVPMVFQQAGKTVVDLVFLPGNSVADTGTLLDGNYRLTVDATRISSDGLALDGNGDGTVGDDYVASAVDGFFRKYGDNDGDDVVSLLDFAAFRSTFGKDVGDDGYISHLNADTQSAIGLLDFAAFRGNFGT